MAQIERMGHDTNIIKAIGGYKLKYAVKSILCCHP